MTLICKCGRQVPTRQSLSVSGKVPVRDRCECGERLRATGGLAADAEPDRSGRLSFIQHKLNG